MVLGVAIFAGAVAGLMTAHVALSIALGITVGLIVEGALYARSKHEL